MGNAGSGSKPSGGSVERKGTKVKRSTLKAGVSHSTTLSTGPRNYVDMGIPEEGG